MEYQEFSELAGTSGRYQLMVFLLLGCGNLYGNLENMAVNFLSPAHAHWCAVTGQDPGWVLENVIPPSTQSNNGHESCTMYAVHFNDTNTDDPPTIEIDEGNTTSCVYGYSFQQGEFGITLTSEFELVCERSWILDAVSPMYSAGFLFGAIIAGSLSDRLGRRTALVVFICVHLVSGVAAALSVNAYMYMISRMVVAAAVRAMCNTGAVFLMESVSSALRIRAMIGYQLMYGLGGFVLVLVAYFIRHFRWLQGALVLPLTLMISYQWVLNESPRWLYMKGRIEESADTIVRIAKRNGRTIPPQAAQDYIQRAQKELDTQVSMASQPRTSSLPFSTLLRHPVVRKYFFACTWLMSSAMVVFLGIGLNIDHLFGDVYENVSISVLLEFPAYLVLWLTLVRAGRKPSLTGAKLGMLVCSVAAIVCQFIPGFEMGVTVLSTMVRSLGSCCILTLVVYMGELFPTCIRQMALGSVCCVAGVCSIFAPLVGGKLASIWEPLPNVVYAVLSLLSAIYCQFLPETLGQQLPDTVDDVCQLGRNKKAPVSKKADKEKEDTVPGYYTHL